MGERLSRVRDLVAQEPGVDENGGALARLCRAAARDLPASGVGMNVFAQDGSRGLIAASDEASEWADELQLTLGEGPCVDAFATRRAVLVPDLAAKTATWPMYAPAACSAGIAATFAFPLQVGAARLGVLDVFREWPGPLSDDELAQALTFAEVAVGLLLDGQEYAGPDATGNDLEAALVSRAELFQAQGMVMVQLGVSLGEAMIRMRAYAYAQERRLIEVARDVVARQLTFDRTDL
jgi:hypothetical protein